MSIHEHAARGNIAGVERALADGVAIDKREPGYGRTPLMAAGSALEARDAFGRTALHLSLQVGDLDKLNDPALKVQGFEAD